MAIVYAPTRAQQFLLCKLHTTRLLRAKTGVYNGEISCKSIRTCISCIVRFVIVVVYYYSSAEIIATTTMWLLIHTYSRRAVLVSNDYWKYRRSIYSRGRQQKDDAEVYDRQQEDSAELYGPNYITSTGF